MVVSVFDSSESSRLRYKNARRTIYGFHIWDWQQGVHSVSRAQDLRNAFPIVDDINPMPMARSFHIRLRDSETV